MKDRRTSITVPAVLDNEIQKHMEQTGIKTWNAALWDLVRAGLEVKKKTAEA
ncbi:hypothetical protein J1TS5_25420 [Paenibacillus macerans]|uniref:hypothetical protein n=1 Tax=Paenibacillus macerans TaxID=44252 RepID=UPI001B2E2A50|nr:hypothetical protein [Paenibacillus macerans]GIP10372.1 hypothetical protein J1TS5_25420 [Paenibacillus macerans]